MLSHPHILLVIVDQMRFDCGGFMAPSRSGPAEAAQTPALDRLASEGVVFEQAYCGSPVCSPARAS